MTSSRYDPKPVRIRLSQSLRPNGPHENSIIQVAVTMLRARLAADWEWPEWEFEGYLVGDYATKIWVGGQLETYGAPKNDCRVISMGTFSVLEPGRQLGVDSIHG